MSSENVEVIARIYEATARGDFWVIGELLDPEIVWSWMPSMAGMTGESEYRGLEGVEAATRDFFAAWDLFREEAVELVDAGDAVVAETRFYARPKGATQEIQGTSWEVWTFRGDRVVRFQQFGSREEARAATGLSG